MMLVAKVIDFVSIGSFSHHCGTIPHQKLTVLWLTTCQDHFASQVESVLPVHPFQYCMYNIYSWWYCASDMRHL